MTPFWKVMIASFGNNDTGLLLPFFFFEQLTCQCISVERYMDKGK